MELPVREGEDFCWLPPERAGVAFRRAAECRALGSALVLAVVVESEVAAAPVGSWMSLPLEGVPPATDDDSLQELIRAARELSGADRGRLLELETSSGRLRVFLDPALPPPHLVILGAGHVGLALATLAPGLGFHLTVVDDRQAFACAERFPMADRLLVGSFPEVLAEIPDDPESYWVIVTRGHRSDEACLEACLRRSWRYLGMLASRRKARLLLGRVRELGFPEELLAQVRTPIGIPIGSVTPEEIAVSIAAELIAARRRRSGHERKVASAAHTG